MLVCKYSLKMFMVGRSGSVIQDALHLTLPSSIVDQILMHWYAEHLLRLRHYLREGVKGINEGTMLNSLAHHHPSIYCKS